MTRNGLDQPVGNAAINSVPRQMIRNSINEICGDYDGGFDVIISVPNGEEIAKKRRLIQDSVLRVEFRFWVQAELLSL